MALSGLHVVCGFAGVPSANRSVQPVLNNIQWSEAPASATPTTRTAPGSESGTPVFRIRTSADAWVAVGNSPVATTNPRVFVAAGADYDLGVSPGDKLAWVAA